MIFYEISPTIHAELFDAFSVYRWVRFHRISYYKELKLESFNMIKSAFTVS